ncbi:NUDIX hydrolase [Candidatus Woesearchaeota archaeon]|nr:NUDIX hydrolase [Candidatus Woesearchaeota archaeon]
METNFSVTAVIRFKGKFLILKRASDNRHHPDRWSFCSGFAKEFEPAEKACLREVKEETGLDIEIIKTGRIVEVIDKKYGKRWVIAAYLCRPHTSDVKLCSENTTFRWASLEELKNYNFVPGLAKDLESLGLA